MNLLSYAADLGLWCLVINSTIAVIYFFKHRTQLRRANAYRVRVDALTVDNAGLRVQNARLMQTVAKLKGGIQRAGEMCENFDLKKEV